MKFYSNKFLISFLILTVLLYSFSVKIAEAKGVIRVLAFVVVVVAVVAAVWFTGGAALAAMGVAGGTGGAIAAGIGLLVLGPALGIGLAQCLVLGQNSFTNPNCGGSSGSSWQGTSGSPTLQNQTATPIVSSDGNCTTGYTLSYSVTDAYQYAIYRDGNMVKQGTLNTIVQPSPYNTSFSYTDDNLAPNTTYTYILSLADKDGKQFRSPEMTAYTECIKLDLKVNGSDEPSTVKVASNYVTLNWITEGALSCSASGDWSGSKGPATGREELGKIARGTSNPGLGKTYNYSMTCQYPKNKTLADSGSVTVFKYPDCDFSADPAVIEVLPATSTLSWDCRYYGGTPNEGSDSCSINQGVGSVSPLKDSVSVRPSQETTYTLTCSTIDKTSDYQASVNIGFRPRVREVIPRW